MKDFSFDTIAAVSTPRGKGGVALIRISGSAATEVADKIFAPASGGTLSQKRARSAIFGKIFTPDGSLCIDEGLAVLFRAPASFTGEDTVEICCHGGALVTRRVLEACLGAGARHAEAGEFTRRAFASGKIGLDEAEALGLLLDAGTDAQLRLSRSGMSGTLGKRCSELRDEATALLTDIYARVDFPEEDLGSISAEETRARIGTLIEKTAALAATYRTGRAVAEGISAVICGRTNAGKSSFYNLLVGEDEAIVTDIAGTTRDVLSTTLSFGDVTLRLFDTAGIRENSSDEVEAIGIRRAIEKIDGAELVFYVIDATRAPDGDDIALAERLLAHEGQVIAVLNKVDSTPCAEAQELFARFSLRARLSALTGEGKSELEALVSSLFIDGELDFSADAIVMGARQYDAIARAADAFAAAAETIDSGFPPDLAGVCLEDAAAALGELDGRGDTIRTDLIDGIFSKFCVGK
jgi:tRNA modification GTPase